MTRLLNPAWRIFVDASRLWLGRNAFTHAGALAFYTLFSLAPVVIIVVSIAGAVFGDDAARGLVAARLTRLVGPDAAHAVQDAVARSRPDVAGVFPAVTGLIALALGATTVFAQMQTSLNRIWGVTARPQRSGITLFVKNRIVSLAIVLTIGLVLLASLVANVVLRSLVAYAEDWVQVSPLLVGAVEIVVSTVVFTLLFAVIFKVLPDAVVGWEDVWVGAATTGVLFVAGQSLIAAYLAVTAPASAYGAAGSLVLLLLWVYYSALILYFGAAVTKAHVLAAGRVVVPRPTAVLVREELAEQGV
ncbi:MAG TPA: YihY/virulence factor BrkB family protein [Vicinamibacterales bacterium]|nr:YihY/virulence factor BrkB family protein [Vicinamibacterales bacterium]